MNKELLSVKFIKGTDEISIPHSSIGFGCQDVSAKPFIQRSADGVSYLFCAKSAYSRQHRYFFSKGSIGGGFSSKSSRDSYMKMINDACGEIVAVPAESMPNNAGDDA